VRIAQEAHVEHQIGVARQPRAKPNDMIDSVVWPSPSPEKVARICCC
jgi:nitrous oxidase accessory protein NosD